MEARQPQSILIIRPSALGDVCRSVPLASSIRAAWPTARISWLVQDSFVDAVRAHPAIDEVIAFPRGQWRRWWRPSTVAAAWRWLGTLAGRFDLVLDAQGLGRSGLMAWATRAPRRVGFADAREFGWLGVNVRVRVAAVHSVDRMLGLVDAIGVAPVRDLSLRAPPEAKHWWLDRRQSLGLGRYVAFAPTTRWPSKAWPAERWGHLVSSLLARGFDHVAYLGSPSERNDVRRALPRGPERERCIDLAGETSVGQSMAVIESSDLVVANDSAPLHMAVGFARPLLALFGPTDPARVGPYGREGCVLRSDEARAFRGSYRDRSIGDQLMRGLGVEEIVAAFDAGRAEAGLRVAGATQ